MRVFRLSEQEFKDAFGIRMASVELGDGPGFSYGIIRPGEQTHIHHHDEAEMFIVLNGRAELHCGEGIVQELVPGDIVSIAPFETHLLCNPSASDFMFLDLYWRDPQGAVAASKASKVEDDRAGPMFVFSTPPTPNGDLHLGHLSGPYLGADAYTRFQRMCGRRVFHLTGSDDFQSYVLAKAREMGTDPQSVASHFAEQIQKTLAAMDIYPDEFYRTSVAAGYVDGAKAFFSRLERSGEVSLSRQPAAFDPEDGTYLYECDVAGLCPTCNAPSGGNICEECGEPNLVFDLKEAKSKISGKSVVLGQMDRYMIRLNRFKDAIQSALRQGRAAPKILRLADRILSRSDFDVPVSHPQEWGIRLDSPKTPDQVLWVWPEMAYGFLYGIQRLGEKTRENWDAMNPQDDWRIVHFLGYDNSFYHTILYPALYSLAFPSWDARIEYNMNEFYLLDGEKFSTSRQHAVWGSEVLNSTNVDLYRFHLSRTRSESTRTNYDHASLQSSYELVLGRWQRWLNDLGKILASDFGSAVPDAGDWSTEQQAFLSTLDSYRRKAFSAFSPNSFSLNTASAALISLVDETIHFAERHRHLREAKSYYDRYRTAISLEVAACSLLAKVSAPIMPSFALRLSQALGLQEAPLWPETVELVPPGSPTKLANATFFIHPLDPRASEHKRARSSLAQ